MPCVNPELDEKCLEMYLEVGQMFKSYCASDPAYLMLRNLMDEVIENDKTDPGDPKTVADIEATHERNDWPKALRDAINWTNSPRYSIAGLYAMFVEGDNHKNHGIPSKRFTPPEDDQVGA